MASAGAPDRLPGLKNSKSEIARQINVFGVVSIDPRTERYNRDIGCRLGEQEKADAVIKQVC
jgi:hypothetical protein